MSATLLALLLFQIPPRPQGPVADYAGVLGPNDAAALGQQLAGTRIAVATFPSLDGEDPEDLTNRIFAQWGVGNKGKEDGVLVAVYVQDRKWRIEVGYGNEAVLTDAQAARVGRETLVPKLQSGDYGGALRATVGRIQDILDRRAVAPRIEHRRGIDGRTIFFLVMLAFILLSRARRSGVLGSAGWLWFLGGMSGWGRGWDDDDDHRGGGWGGGGWGGGGGGGTFGGGSSGGGGAGGSW